MPVFGKAHMSSASTYEREVQRSLQIVGFITRLRAHDMGEDHVRRRGAEPQTLIVRLVRPLPASLTGMLAIRATRKSAAMPAALTDALIVPWPLAAECCGWPLAPGIPTLAIGRELRALQPRHLHALF